MINFRRKRKDIREVSRFRHLYRGKEMEGKIFGETYTYILNE